MSLLPYATQGGIGLPFYIPVDQKVSTFFVSTLTVNNIDAKNLSTFTLNAHEIYAWSTFSCNVLANYTETTELYVYDIITLDNQQLTANGTDLLLNGIPIATTANLSSISDWAFYPATSTIQVNSNNIKGTNLLQANTIGVSTMAVCNLTGIQGAFTNLFTQNLMAANIVNFTSTVIEVFESTIQSDIKLANISTLNAGGVSCASISTNTITANVGFFSTLTAASINVSSIIAPVNPNLVLSSLTTQTLNVTNSGTFANGGTFNGTRPNFTTGINTSGPNNFNFQSLDNIRQVTGSNIDMFANDTTGLGGESMTLGADGGTFTAFYPTTNIISRYGGGGQINITAERPSLLVGVPSQNVNITAKGGVGYYTGIPVGGGVNISAEAGGANLFTTTGVLANGAIRQTAYTFFNGIYTVPGFAARSAGCSAEYSGLTSPTLPLYGCSFYSALISLSLTAGVTPASVSFPGVVYLRGDNGTKVVNGFYADTINNNVGYDLNIQSLTTPVLDTSNRNINLNSYNNINLNTQNGGQVYINGTPYSNGGGGGGWVSTAASDLNMNGYDIVDPSLLNISTPFLYLNGHTVTAITTSNAVIDATQDIRLNSPSNIYMSTQTVDFQESLLRGAVFSTNLGLYQPFKFIYEPPTAAGQSAEFAIQAHPQDAGVIYNLRYGIDMAAGSAYLFAEWPGYIVVPITISGQVVTLGQGEGVVTNTNNYINNNTNGAFNVSSLTTNLSCQSDMVVNAPSTLTVTTKNFQVTEGTSQANIQLYNSGGTQFVDIFTGAGENELLLSQSSGATVKSSTFTNIIGRETNITGYSTINFYGKIVEHNNLDMNGFNLLAGNTIETQTINNNPINPYLTIQATSSITMNASNAIVFNSAGNFFNSFVTMAGNTFYTGGGSIYTNNGYIFENGGTYFYYGGNINSSRTSGVNYLDLNAPPTTSSGTGQLRFFGNKGSLIFDDNVALSAASNAIILTSPNINLYGNVGIIGTLYMNSNNIEQIRSLYFQTTGNIDAYQSAGVNYLNINAPTTTGSGTGQLRLLGNKGNMIFDDNITIGGNGSNQVGLYNQYGYVYLGTNQNVYLGGGGSHLGGEDQIIVHGLINSDSRIYTGTSGDGFLQQNGTGFIKTRVDAGAYGGLSMNGYFQVCQTGTTSTIFSIPSDNNQNMWYNNGSGGFGIGTTTPYYKLDVIGDVRVSQDLYANNAVYRNLSATAVAQPVIQYGEDAGSGTSGNITITIPVAYTSATSYVVFASMMDTGDCKISVNRDSASQITVYWSQAGSGSHKIGWQTSGT